jgi:hypothetical protein
MIALIDNKFSIIIEAKCIHRSIADLAFTFRIEEERITSDFSIRRYNIT